MKLGWTPAYRASRRPDIFFSGSGPMNDRSRSLLTSRIHVPFGHRVRILGSSIVCVVGTYLSSAMQTFNAYR